MAPLIFLKLIVQYAIYEVRSVDITYRQSKNNDNTGLNEKFPINLGIKYCYKKNRDKNY